MHGSVGLRRNILKVKGGEKNNGKGLFTQWKMWNGESQRRERSWMVQILQDLHLLSRACRGMEMSIPFFYKI
ncbi:MAG: hypothetical protein A3J55_01450 [Candidatus Ryanbacteria bacterium RIFCSPHIGHO2_02_FULL_45_17b]|uniref:Uncharacterized protein n=1 Tax=Candidatus Ryanbacteria bacterium RIFCSPHIGHO2_01_FULL_45_22 TaxID=1802114 RepID=A0A1G2G122_9BACT|nr:MAG: hypothetical protein A2719_00265 [Candidatus Ryanbacteria bacterium RIFCSPHIGHO2_01_FULL_45_22]OGZ47433.1 MAG: hypothetical protein A3J55_01450 [Candidatus Ryanbacteria bacterium RIFCSPHIGHO2_02_FULL_45_17b]